MESNAAGDQLREEKLARQREYKRQWYLANKEMAIAKAKQYRREHKDRCKEYQQKWMVNNEEKCQQYHRDYYLQNREAILEKLNTPHECALCGGRYTRAYKSRHCRTHKHALALKHKLEQEQATTDLSAIEG